MQTIVPAGEPAVVNETCVKQWQHRCASRDVPASGCVQRQAMNGRGSGARLLAQTAFETMGVGYKKTLPLFKNITSSSAQVRACSCLIFTLSALHPTPTPTESPSHPNPFILTVSHIQFSFTRLLISPLHCAAPSPSLAGSANVATSPPVSSPTTPDCRSSAPGKNIS